MNCLIYSGPGVSEEGVTLLKAALDTLIGDSYAVQLATAKILSGEPWEKSTALLVIPGGRDLPYMAELGGRTNARIVEWVHSGGRYLGICAGECAY